MLNMYKSVNVNEKTYQQLQRIATQKNLPKAQVVASLVKAYEETMKEREKTRLVAFNKKMRAKMKALTLSKKIKITTDTIDDQFVALADSDYTG